ncbi:tyrosine-protein kinase transmembrane receptor Ror2-like [Amblyomma americanum]
MARTSEFPFGRGTGVTGAMFWFSLCVLLQAALPTTMAKKPVILEGPQSRTVVRGSQTVFRCLVEPPPSSPRPRSGGGVTSVTWLLDGEKLSEDGYSPLRFLDNGGLLLRQVEPRDAGSYRCSARNDHGLVYSDAAELVVHVPAELEGPPRTTLNVSAGAAVVLRCDAEGNPPPVITWFKNGKKVPEPSRVSHSTLTINATASAAYMCHATNFVGEERLEMSDTRVFVVQAEGSPPEPVILEGPRSRTVVRGSRVLLPCRVEPPPSSSRPGGGDASSVLWLLDGRSLAGQGSSAWRQLDNGDLLLLEVEPPDAGSYRCSARNGHGVAYSESAELFVHVPAELEGPPRTTLNVSAGAAVVLRCDAEGNPPPVITWFKNGKKVPSSELSRTPEPQLSINVTASATYVCRAVNFVGENHTEVSDAREFVVQVEGIPPVPGATREGVESTSDPSASSAMVQAEQSRPSSGDDDEDASGGTSGSSGPGHEDVPQGFCSPYTGSVCRRFLGPSGLVYYNISQDASPVVLNEQLTQQLWEEFISSLLEPCRSAAEVMICHYAFPQCEWRARLAIAKPLCREDCIAVRELFCYNEWAMIEDNKQRGIFFKSRGHFRLPDCEQLPSYKNNTGECSHAHLTDFKEDEVTVNCIKGRGRFYQGAVNVTKSGIPCQRWSVQEPHHHNRPPMVFPEVLNSENYCRNAGGEEPMPWCYTTDPRKRWEHCSIPQCENTTLGDVSGRDILDLFEPPGEPSFAPALVLLVSAVSLAALVVLLSLALGCRRLRRYGGSRSRGGGYNATPTADVEIDLDKLPSNASYHHTAARLHPRLEKLEYPRNDIIYLRDIGQGAFGRVFQAKAPGLIKGDEFTTVAVKMLKEEASEDLQSDFEREACLMAEFDHPNIVKLLGVCAVGSPMCLLFEYMGKGDLNEYLRSCSPSNYIVRNPSGGCGDMFSDVRLSHVELVSLARQIAAGMVYLSERKFVHRDLATRNCLISDDMVVKIADFGLSQKMYAADYYRGSEHDAIPIRWMPLEAILYNKFTVESDVWAFGVVLWEIFSFALQPYYGMTHEEVVAFVKEGNCLGCPEGAPAPAYALMRACWNRKPSARPSFKTIHRALGTLHNELVKHRDKENMVHV